MSWRSLGRTPTSARTSIDRPAPSRSANSGSVSVHRSPRRAQARERRNKAAREVAGRVRSTSRRPVRQSFDASDHREDRPRMRHARRATRCAGPRCAIREGVRCSVSAAPAPGPKLSRASARLRPLEARASTVTSSPPARGGRSALTLILLPSMAAATAPPESSYPPGQQPRLRRGLRQDL